MNWSPFTMKHLCEPHAIHGMGLMVSLRRGCERLNGIKYVSIVWGIALSFRFRIA